MAGAATVGKLVIQMGADIAQLKTDLSNATSVVESTMGNIDKAAGVAKNALIGLAAGFSVNWAAGMIAESIEATGALNDLAEQTGISVGALSSIRDISKIAGTDFSVVTQAIGGLEQSMFKAAAGSDKMQGAFQTLGVEIKNADGTLRSAEDVFLDTSVAMSNMEAGATKAGLAQTLMKGAGRELIEVMNVLGERGEYVASVTERQAAVADDLGENWRRLKQGGEEFWRIVSNALAPALDSLVKMWISLSNESGGFRDKLRELAADGTLEGWAMSAGRAIATFLDVVVSVKNGLVALGETIGAVIFATSSGIEAIVTASDKLSSGDFTGAFDALSTGVSNVKIAWDGVRESWGNFEWSTSFRDAFDKSATSVGNLESAARSAAPAVIDLKEAKRLGKEQAKEYAQAVDTLREAVEKLGKDNAVLDAQIQSLRDWGVEAKSNNRAAIDWEIDNGKLADALARIRKETGGEDAANAMAAWLRSQADAKDAAIITKDALEKQIKATKDHNDELVKSVTALGDQVTAAKLQNDQFGLSRGALIDVTIAQEEYKLSILQTAEGITNVDLKAQELRIQKLKELKGEIARGDELQAWRGVFDSVQGAATNFLVDFTRNGMSAFRNLWESFKNWALQALAEIAAKQIVVSLVGALGIGGSAGAQAAGSLATGDAGSMLLNVLGLGGKAAGGGEGGILGTLLGGGGVGIGTALENIGTIIPTFTTLLEGGATVMEALSASFAGMGSSFASLLGPIGLVAGGAMLLKNYLDSKRGGPMTREYGMSEGSSLGDFGDMSGLHKLVGTDAVVSPQYSKFANTLSGGYDAALDTLGGTGSARFSVYTSQDPKGTAPSSVDIRANVGGAEAYRGDNANVGRDSASLQAEIERQGQMAILGALRASNLPAVVLEFLGMVDIGDLTLEKIVGTAAVLEKLPEDLQARFLEAVKTNPEIVAALGDFSAAYVALNEALMLDPEAEAIKLTTDAHELSKQKVKELKTELDSANIAYTDATTAATAAGLSATDLAAAQTAQTDASNALRTASMDYLEGVASSNATAYEKTLAFRSGLEGLATTYDGSTEQTNELAWATGEYVKAQVQALAEIIQLKSQLSTMFGDSIKQLDMAIMSSAERGEFLKSEALKTIELLKETTDPAKIKEFSTLINKDLTQAFSLLSPEEQKRQHDLFVKYLDDTSKLTTEQLNEAGEVIKGETTDNKNVMDIIREKLAAAADKQFSAATKLEQAADQMNAAAATNNNAATSFYYATGTLQNAADLQWSAANAMPTSFTVTVENSQP